MAVKVSSTAVLLATSVFLARTLGPSGYGAYAFAYSIVAFAVLFAQLGIPELTVREVSQRLALERGSLLARYLKSARTGSIILSIIVAMCVGVALLVAELGEAQQRQLMLAGLPVILLMPAIALSGAIIRGTGRVVQGVLGPQLFRPGLFLALLLVATVMQFEMTPLLAMILQSSACALVMIESAVRARRALPRLGNAAAVAPERYRRWSTAALMFSGIAVIHLINSKFDTIALGVLTNDTQVGLYAVGVQMAQAAAAMLLITAVVVMPGISRASAQNDLETTEQLCRQSAFYSVAGAICALIGFVVLGRWAIGLVFGAQYEPVWTATLILIGGQTANAFFGPVGILLNMRGEERSTFIITALAALVNVALNFYLIPRYGLEGAAIATAIAMLLWNIVLWLRALLIWGINTSAIPNGLLLRYLRQTDG